MWFAKLQMRWKIVLIMVAVFFPIWTASVLYFFYETYWLQVQSQVAGLMNFNDAKQQGVIRFLGQNRKQAAALATLVGTISDDALREYLRAIVRTDVFAVEDHPFKNEIISGRRKIATWQVYRSIDIVKDGVIVLSSDTSREGRAWTAPAIDPQRSYSDVYRDPLQKGAPVVSFAAPVRDGRTLYVNADAKMMTLITNGEIGNLEKGMGTFYLAGVGKTFDYYMVDRSNLLITDSRLMEGAFLMRSGSEVPWRTTIRDASLGIVCSANGTYKTNAKTVTGCREAMGFYPGVNGKLKLGASMPFYDSEWTLVVEQDADELLQPLYQLYRRMALTAIGAAFLVTILFVLAINRYVFRPLKVSKRAVAS